MNCISNFFQSLINCIVNPIKRVSTMISYFCMNRNNDLYEPPMKRVKNSNEELDEKRVFKKRISYANLNEEFKDELKETEGLLSKINSKLILSIDDKTPFLKNTKSKSELREKIELIENNMYIKCKYCGNEVKNSDIYLIYDKHYCSELCRHRMLFKK